MLSRKPGRKVNSPHAVIPGSGGVTYMELVPDLYLEEMKKEQVTLSYSFTIVYVFCFELMKIAKFLQRLLADPREARGCPRNTLLIILLLN